jgi:hypothetical protein
MNDCEDYGYCCCYTRYCDWSLLAREFAPAAEEEEEEG